MVNKLSKYLNGMVFYTYILYSQKLNIYYKGHTKNLEQRLKRHNHGMEKFTKKGVPWTLLWFTIKKSKTEAYRLELKLKNLSQLKTLAFMKKYNEGDVGPDEPDFLVRVSGC